MLAVIQVKFFNTLITDAQNAKTARIFLFGNNIYGAFNQERYNNKKKYMFSPALLCDSSLDFSKSVEKEHKRN